MSSRIPCSTCNGYLSEAWTEDARQKRLARPQCCFCLLKRKPPVAFGLAARILRAVLAPLGLWIPYVRWTARRARRQGQTQRARRQGVA